MQTPNPLDAKREENNKKYDAAYDNAKKALEDARAELQAAEQAAANCSTDTEKQRLADAEEANGLMSPSAEDIVAAQEEYESAKRAADNADKHYRFTVKLVEQAKNDLNNAGFFSKPSAKRALNSAEAKMVAAKNASIEADKKLAEAKANKPTEKDLNRAKAITESLEKAQKALEEKQKECNDLKEASQAAKAKLDGLGYDENDLNKMADLVKRAKKKYTGVATAWVRDKNGDKNLEDLRNLDGKNFRSVAHQNEKRIDDTGGLNAMKGGDAGVSPARSFYMNEDYLFTDSLTSPTLDAATFASKPELQTLILSEFQPYNMLSIADLLPGAADAMAGAMNTVGKLVGQTAISIAKNALINGQIDRFSKNPSELYEMGYSGAENGGTRERKYFTPDPVQQVQNMFNGGKWLNTYELPYWGNMYLKGQYSNDWDLGNIQNALGKGLGEMLGNFGVDYPANPKFKVSMKPTRDQIKTEFYLINSSSEWLRRNFEFIQAIFAGTLWLHMKYCLVRPTNVYHVLCPGRFQIYWAAMDAVITFEGKLRKSKDVSRALRGYGINSIDEDMLWPDAWKISLNIRDLTPNNFNLYAEYYARGYIEDEVAMLGNQISLGKMINEIGGYFNEFKDDTKKALDDMKKQAKQSVGDVNTGNKWIDGAASGIGDMLDKLPNLSTPPTNQPQQQQPQQ